MEHGAFGGQEQSPSYAVEELEVNCRLQVVNQPADGRLRGVQQDRGVHGCPGVDDGSERLYLMVGDLHVISQMNRIRKKHYLTLVLGVNDKKGPSEDGESVFRLRRAGKYRHRCRPQGDLGPSQPARID